MAAPVQDGEVTRVVIRLVLIEVMNDPNSCNDTFFSMGENLNSGRLVMPGNLPGFQLNRRLISWLSICFANPDNIALNAVINMLELSCIAEYAPVPLIVAIVTHCMLKTMSLSKPK